MSSGPFLGNPDVTGRAENLPCHAFLSETTTQTWTDRSADRSTARDPTRRNVNQCPFRNAQTNTSRSVTKCAKLLETSRFQDECPREPLKNLGISPDGGKSSLPSSSSRTAAKGHQHEQLHLSSGLECFPKHVQRVQLVDDHSAGEPKSSF